MSVSKYINIAQSGRPFTERALVKVWYRTPCLYVETALGKPLVPVSLATQSVVLREEPQLIAFGYRAIDRHTFKAIKAFIRRHRSALLRHWQGETDSPGVLTELGLRGPAEKTFQKT
jgi:hypothetical protein